jgi:hypothetical protein
VHGARQVEGQIDRHRGDVLEALPVVLARQSELRDPPLWHVQLVQRDRQRPPEVVDADVGRLHARAVAVLLAREAAVEVAHGDADEVAVAAVGHVHQDRREGAQVHATRRAVPAEQEGHAAGLVAGRFRVVAAQVVVRFVDPLDAGARRREEMRPVRGGQEVDGALGQELAPEQGRQREEDAGGDDPDALGAAEHGRACVSCRVNGP